VEGRRVSTHHRSTRHNPGQGQPAPATARQPVRGRGEHAQLAARLTHRDRWMLRMLAEHRVLTTHHLAALAFPSERSAQLRLRALFTLGVIDRFQPLTPTGSAPLHWVLDTPGAAVLAAEDGHNQLPGAHRHVRALAVAHSTQLEHLLGVNTCLIGLAASATRAPRRSALELWWSQARCTRNVGDFTRPDAYAIWHHEHHRLPFFFEYDTGTEALHRLGAKLAGYYELATATAIATPVLFWLPTPAREAAARHALSHAAATLEQPHRVPIATATPAAAGPAGPAGAGWQPLTTAHPAVPAAHTPPAGPSAGAAPIPGGRGTLAALAALWPHTATHHHAHHHGPGAATLGRRSAAAGELAAPCPMPPPPQITHPAQRQ